MGLIVLLGGKQNSIKVIVLDVFALGASLFTIGRADAGITLLSLTQSFLYDEQTTAENFLDFSLAIPSMCNNVSSPTTVGYTDVHVVDAYLTLRVIVAQGE